LRYRCIRRRRYQYPIRMMCRLLGVSRSGYYDWCNRDESTRARNDRALSRMIRELHEASGGVYGARKLHRELIDHGQRCGRHKVAKLMRQSGLKGYPKRRFRRARNGPITYPFADNLLKQDFKAKGINERWSSDITFIVTRQGWLYLAVVMDLFSRRIIGWSMDRRVGRHLVVDALTMALDHRTDKPAIHHSDRGVQYSSDDFRDLLKEEGIECSMSGVGCCYDNAPVESFFSLLKRERVRRKTYATRDEAKADVFDYIECFYNRKRRHGYLDYTSPVAFEMRTQGP
jgi:putative transposase